MSDAAAAPVGCCAFATICAVPPAERANVAGVTFSDVMPEGSAVTVMAEADVSVVAVKPVPVLWKHSMSWVIVGAARLTQGLLVSDSLDHKYKPLPLCKSRCVATFRRR